MPAAANERQMLPPTVAVFQILNDASSALAASTASGAAVQAAGASRSAQRTRRAIVQVAPMRRPSVVTSRSGQPIAMRSTKPVVAGCGSLISQVPPAMTTSPSARARSSAVRAARKSRMVVMSTGASGC